MITGSGEMEDKRLSPNVTTVLTMILMISTEENKTIQFSFLFVILFSEGKEGLYISIARTRDYL